jgi:acetyltransferase-like isoleucine patch superfamily enzyme
VKHGGRSTPAAPPFIHPQAIVESAAIGARTRVWAFVHVLPGAVIGVDCNLCDHVFVENRVRVGDRVTVKSGVQLWDGIELEDDVFVGPNATFTNDRFPRSRRWQESVPRTLVKAGASIGANATILPGLTIGRGAMVGAGAVVTRDVPPHAIVAGNPATIRGYADAESPASNRAAAASRRPPSRSRVRGVTIHPLHIARDLRGSLAVADFGADLPFAPLRLFSVSQVPGRHVRGEHAHRRQHQFLVCLHGELSLLLDDGTRREELLLDSPAFGVHIPPLVWAAQFGFSDDAVLCVLASGPYEPEEYIREYEQFLALVAAPAKRERSRR